MALDFAVKVSVKVIPSAHHPVFRIICWLGCVRSFVDVVTVVASYLNLLAEPITSHDEPRPPVLNKWKHRRRNRHRRVDGNPVIFPSQVDFSSAEAGVH